MSADTESALPSPIGSGFDAIVGQATILTALRRAISRDRLPHALLFTGPTGVGKASTGLILAQALNCAITGPADACGDCPSCDRIARGIHPDFFWLAPSPRVIRMRQVRTVIGAAGYRPHEGRRRVVLIDEAHAMQGPAQNAFLKTLEEPPPSTLLVLVTPSAGSLLPTVRSRCQELRFSPVGLDAVRGYLRERMGMDAAEADLRSALKPGSIGGALAVDLEVYGAMLETVVEALRLAQRGGAGVVAGAESLANIGQGETAVRKAASTLRVGRDVLRDLLVVTTSARGAGLVNGTQEAAWRAWGEELESAGVIGALGALNRGIERFTSGITPNIKMALEQTLIEVGTELAGDSRRV